MKEYDVDFLETFYEVVAAFYLNPTSKILENIEQTKGRGGMWEYAEELTAEFQELHKNTDWDGDFFDELENFLTNKI